MRKTTLKLVLCLLPAVVPAAGDELSGLAFMAGCWAQDGRDPGSIEQWMAPAGGSMLGMSRVVSDGRTVAIEYLRIVREDDATWLIASPSGQPTARFRLVELRDGFAAFSNPDHDFPQTISYSRGADDRLLGRISGEEDGVAKSATFPMTRTDCVNGDGAE